MNNKKWRVDVLAFLELSMKYDCFSYPLLLYLSYLLLFKTSTSTR